MKTKLFVIFLLFGFSQMQAQEYLERMKMELIPEIEKLIQKSKVKGLSIALVDNQEIVWAQGFGFSNEEKGIPATEQTVYRIASVSKLFVATAIMQLHEQGKLHLDSSLVNYIPEFTIHSDYGNTNKITLRNLLTHHSGLPSDILNGMFTIDVKEPESILELLRVMHVPYPPDYIFAYSNIGFSLLGIVIERVAGISLEEYMQKNIYAPLQMTHSSFEMPPHIKSFYSEAYLNKVAFSEPPIREKAAGLMVSNVLDLAQFVKFMLAFEADVENKLLTPESYSEMVKKQNLDIDFDLDFSIGLAWWLNKPRQLDYAGDVISHGGDTEAFHSMLSILKDKKLGVIVLTNTDRGAAIRSDLAYKILASALKHKEGLEKNTENQKKASRLKNISSFKVFAGDYASPVGILSLQSKSKYLKTKIQGIPINLYPMSDSSFLAKINLLLVKIPLQEEKFVFRVFGSDSVLAMNNEILGLKVQDVEFDTLWNPYLGKYKNNQIGNNRFYPEDVEIYRQDNYLILKMTVSGQKLRLLLETFSPGHARIKGLGRNMQEHIFLKENNGQVFLEYSGYSLEKILE